MLELNGGRYRVGIDPARGGSIAAFEWADAPILRPSGPGSMQDTACFALVPFSNRIARGSFVAGGQSHRMAPNAPGTDPRNPIHGFGWISEWEIVESSARHAVIEHHYPGDSWPWRYRAHQRFELGDNGLSVELGVTNMSGEKMPAGLGFHPYFPLTPKTRYHGLHCGEWRVDEGCLPVALEEQAEAVDWWAGAPVSSRRVDTVYTGRSGPLTITWPERALQCTLSASDNLSSTVIYTPADQDFFCVEPVSHATDAINRPDGNMVTLDPGATMQAWMRLEVGHTKASTP